MVELNCPSCAAKVAFQSSLSILAICSHCRTQVLREDKDLKDLGKVADLHQDGSVLQLGARGEHRGVAFSVVGRIQLRFEDGWWSEWHLAMADGRQGWLGESCGTYAVSYPAPDAKVPSFKSLVVGHEARVGDARYVVTDLRTAAYLSAEGELPSRPPLGGEAALADLRGPGTRFATLDYSDDKPAAYVGEYLRFEALKLDGLKAVEGW